MDILKDERDTMINELQETIRDSGNATNELYEVLRLRDKMAKEFVAYRIDTEKTIDDLNEELTQKGQMIETVIISHN